MDGSAGARGETTRPPASHAPAVDRPSQALGVLRVVVALLLVVHGVARASLGIVDDFGVFLAGVGLPVGPALAWLLTGVEVVGGLALAAGWLVRPLCAWFGAQLLAGIVLVHLPEGWFVVGAGRNGMEYSVLLLAVLGAVAWGTEGGADPRGRTGGDHAPPGPRGSP